MMEWNHDFFSIFPCYADVQIILGRERSEKDKKNRTQFKLPGSQNRRARERNM